MDNLEERRIEIMCYLNDIQADFDNEVIASIAEKLGIVYKKNAICNGWFLEEELGKPEKPD